MKAYAKVREFEKAGEVKNRIFALKHINDVALIKGDNPPHISDLETRGRDLLVGKIEGSRAYRIEAYDIAHMSGKNMAGVMTVVENGAVIKSDYKKFRIRSQSGSNDTGALTEVLERRLRHQEWGYPNLIVIDGGVAQINAAKAVLYRMDLQIEVAAVVKDHRHKPKAILGDDQVTKKYKSAILLANSEAHRFAIAYHKNMRGRNFLNKK
jgi:excinuclease ABC subunit C